MRYLLALLVRKFDAPPQTLLPIAIALGYTQDLMVKPSQECPKQTTYLAQRM